MDTVKRKKAFLPDIPDVPFLQNALLQWFAREKRPLPWRDNPDPYRTWIAEMMMQQTQMDRGVEYFQRWMRMFPDIASVAEASEERLFKAWEGLGYYRRVRYIQQAARRIMTQYGGIFPETFEAILSLPGIGPYTAGAIASTAFNLPEPCIDGNAERVLSRICRIETPVRENPAKGWLRRFARDLIPEGRARELNQSLMELGALICRKKPLCSQCPVASCCSALAAACTDRIPVSGRSSRIVRMDTVCGILIHRGCIFLQRRLPGDVWGGLWEFPGGCVEPEETPEEAVIREWREETGFQVQIVRRMEPIRHSYTVYRMLLHGFVLTLPADQKDAGYPSPPLQTASDDFVWISPETLQNPAMPAPHRKLADMIQALYNTREGRLQLFQNTNQVWNG